MMKQENGTSTRGSIQPKGDRLYLVVSYKDLVTHRRKNKWIGLGLSPNAAPEEIERARGQALAKFEQTCRRWMEGGDDPEHYPLLEFLRDWLEDVQRYRVQESSYCGYQKMLTGRIQTYFDATVVLSDCKPRLFHRFYDYLRREGLSENSVLHYHNFFHGAFEYAVRQEILEYNPIDRVERPKIARFTGSFYSAEQVRHLLSCAEGEPIYLPVVLAAYYGLRRSEALGLSWSSIDFEHRVLTIRQKVIEVERNGKNVPVISDAMKTESSRRTLPLLPEVEAILLKHRAQQEKARRTLGDSYNTQYTDLVCVDPSGDLLTPRYVTYRFRLLLQKNGLPQIRFHDLRHTCASLLLGQNIHMKVIQMWLGHSTMSTTADIYAHLDATGKSEAGRVLTRLIDGAKRSNK